MHQLAYLKAHGAGNDFVLLPDPDDTFALTAGLVQALCDRHRGIGGDGVIRLGAPRDRTADVFMDYRNADGSVAEMCGNGVRTVAKYLVDRGLTDGHKVAVDTRAGIKDVVCHVDAHGLVQTCTVDMGPPIPGEVSTALTLADGTSVAVTTVSLGNPHAVIVVDDIGTAPVTRVGNAVEHHPAFPEGVNVEFITVTEPGTLHGRIWERGVGETLASGTGGSAMAVAAVLNDLTERHVAVHLPGGVLDVEWAPDTLFVTGPAVEVGGGTIDESWLSHVLMAADR